ncbi:2OG-Fe dioxygenase family protein [Nonomuraea guangzhouensis]|uniref:2OG-Fe dioxygenase family protein n=1 Tax=Nonomuraea guangzhouensis TaxID=1291555 RepID=A0ABW4GY35_9ACTN|nr:2OG-Fe dioxygenase family protein [Nonomuraea guangzhouensis]
MIIPRGGEPRHVRVAVLDEQDRVLLVRHARPAEPAFWSLPGRPLRAGESAVDGCLRLLGELGLTASPAGAPLRRTVTFERSGELVRHEQDIVLCRCGAGRRSPGEGGRWWPPAALPSGEGDRWWPLAALPSATEPVYPRDLADLVREWMPGVSGVPRTRTPSAASEESQVYRHGSERRAGEMDALRHAAHELSQDGNHVMGSAGLSELLGARPPDWQRFARHWEELILDTYMRDGGTYRYRRFGQYDLDTGTRTLTRLPHTSYRQELSVNTLNGGIDRKFEPLTDGFATDPLLEPLIWVLGDVVSAVEGIDRWCVQVHPFRIITSAEQVGKPAPQGRHRDGVTFVTSLLVNRINIVGGESSVHTDDGEVLRVVTLEQPGDQLVLDDRRLQHYVTPIEPLDPQRFAARDVLIVDFVPPADATKGQP